MTGSQKEVNTAIHITQKNRIQKTITKLSRVGYFFIHDVMIIEPKLKIPQLHTARGRDLMQREK